MRFTSNSCVHCRGPNSQGKSGRKELSGPNVPGSSCATHSLHSDKPSIRTWPQNKLVRCLQSSACSSYRRYRGEEALHDLTATQRTVAEGGCGSRVIIVP